MKTDLIDVKIDLNQQLFDACDENTIDIQKITDLLEKNADPNKTFLISQRTALHKLCMNENMTVGALQLIIQKITNIDCLDFYGRTPLLSACQNKNINMLAIKLLLEHKADWNKLRVDSTPFEVLLDSCIKEKNFKNVVDLLCYIPKTKDNAIELIINDQICQDVMETLPLSINFKESFHMQPEMARKSIFTFYCVMHKWRNEKDPRQITSKYLWPYICKQAYPLLPNTILVKNSKSDTIYTRNLLTESNESQKEQKKDNKIKAPENMKYIVNRDGKRIAISQSNEKNSTVSEGDNKNTPSSSKKIDYSYIN